MVQARAITAGLIGSPPLPTRVIDCDLVHVLALIESIVCETPEAAQQVQKMYDDARPAPPPPPVTRGEERRAEIDRLLNL